MFDHFYSDPHFGHRSILKYAGRRYWNIEDHDRDLILRYNAQVREYQIVLWLGDCSFHGADRFREILSELNGRRALVRGNHDKSAAVIASEFEFEFVAERLILEIAGEPVLACHFPGQNASKKHDEKHHNKRPKLAKGEWLIHGHTHSPVRQVGRQIHVGVDAWDLSPVSVQQVAEIIRNGPKKTLDGT